MFFCKTEVILSEIPGFQAFQVKDDSRFSKFEMFFRILLVSHCVFCVCLFLFVSFREGSLISKVI